MNEKMIEDIFDHIKKTLKRWLAQPLRAKRKKRSKMIDETQREHSSEEELIYYTKMLKKCLEASHFYTETIKQLNPFSVDILFFREELERTEMITKELREKIALLKFKDKGD